MERSVERGVQTGALLVLCIIAAGGALYWLRPVMVPFIFAVFIAVALTGMTDLLVSRLRLRRPVAVALTAVLGALALASFGAIVSVSYAEIRDNAGAYQARLTAAGTSLVDLAQTKLVALRERLPEPAARALPDVEQIQSIVRGLIQPVLGTTSGLLVDVSNAILSLLSQSLLVLFFVIFLMLGGSAGQRPRDSMLTEAEMRIRRYLLTKGVVSAATGLLVALVLWLLGVKLALMFGFLAFLLNFIPNVGSIIATMLPLPVVLLDPESTGVVIAGTIVLPSAIQIVLGNIVEPKLMGESLDLHPIVILMSLIFWGMLWGIPGMLLAAPLSAIMKIVFARIEQTHALSELMAGRIPAHAPELAPAPADGASSDSAEAATATELRDAAG